MGLIMLCSICSDMSIFIFRKKLLTTTQYIYKALFKEQRNSDISVMALGKIWRLHKVYLCQSSYFASMFNGSWRETDSSFVNIEIIDPKIDINGKRDADRYFLLSRC